MASGKARSQPPKIPRPVDPQVCSGWSSKTDESGTDQSGHPLVFDPGRSGIPRLAEAALNKPESGTSRKGSKEKVG